MMVSNIPWFLVFIVNEFNLFPIFLTEYIQYHVMNHKGNWLGTYFRQIFDEQRQIY